MGTPPGTRTTPSPARCTTARGPTTAPQSTSTWAAASTSVLRTSSLSIRRSPVTNQRSSLPVLTGVRCVMCRLRGVRRVSLQLPQRAHRQPHRRAQGPPRPGVHRGGQRQRPTSRPHTAATLVPSRPSHPSELSDALTLLSLCSPPLLPLLRLRCSSRSRTTARPVQSTSSEKPPLAALVAPVSPPPRPSLTATSVPPVSPSHPARLRAPVCRGCHQGAAHHEPAWDVPAPGLLVSTAALPCASTGCAITYLSSSDTPSLPSSTALLPVHRCVVQFDGV